MASHNDFGKMAEDMACDFLQKLGYKILARNFLYQKAEIDIICKKAGEIVFAEVKARMSNAMMEPQEAVTKGKMRRIISAADAFLQSIDAEETARFDIITVMPSTTGNLEINHIEAAFESIDAV